VLESKNPDAFTSLGGNPVLLDVRTPAEFEAGHIPGAVSFPLFTNDERAEIGTLYKKKGKEPAILLGLEKVGPRLREMTEQGLQIYKNQGILPVYCWRGGMRSGSVANFFSFLGLNVISLRGGYKAYRNFTLDLFSHPYKMTVIGGFTGSGKTHILKVISKKGEQIIDLEEIANHKGSAFGGIGLGLQPTQEQFENNLGLALKDINPDQRLWLEDESRLIGKKVIPEKFWNQMRKASLISIEVPVSERVKNLLSDYAEFNPEEAKKSVLNLEKRLGLERTKMCLEALDSGNYELVASETLKYYDGLYAKGQLSRTDAPVYSVAPEGKDFNEKAEWIIRYATQNQAG
jgi:tRNA 2-selenouridine synthase